MSRVTLLLAGAALALCALAAGAVDLAPQINDIRNGDEAAAQDAVNALANVGAPAVETLVYLMSDADPQIALWGRIGLETLVDRATEVGKEPVAVALALVQQFGHRRPATARQFIFRMIVRCGGDEVVPALAELLRSPRDAELARWTLENLPGAAATAALCEAAKTASPPLRAAIISALGHRADPAGLPTIRAALGDRAEAVRLNAIDALGGFADPTLAPILQRLATRGSAAARDRAMRAYVRLADALYAATKVAEAERMYLWLTGRPESHLKCAGLTGFAKTAGADAVPALIAAVGSDDPEVSGAAKMALVALPMREVTNQISAAIGGRPAASQVALINALKLRRDAQAVPALAAALRLPSKPVQLAALDALARLQAPESAEEVIGALRRGDNDVRAAAEATLKMIPGDEAARAIAFGAKLGSPPVRAALIRCLYARTEPGVVQTLTEELADSDEDVSKAAAETLGRMRGPAVLDALIAALRDAGDEARIVILGVLADARDERVFPPVIEAAESPNDDVSVAGLSALGKFGDRRGVPIARRMAREGSERRRAAGVRAMLAIGAEVAKSNAAAVLPIYHEALQLASTDEERRLSLQAVGSVGDVKSLGTVVPYLDSPNDGVREAAATAVVPMAIKLAEAGNVDRAVKLLMAAAERSRDRKALADAGAQLRARGINIDIAAKAGFITRYCVLGPVSTREALRKGDAIDPAAAPSLTEPVKAGDATLKWNYRPVDDPSGMLDLEKAAARKDNTGAYVYAEVTSDAARDVLLKIGSDDDVVCWLNGQNVFQFIGDRGWGPDQNSIETKLVAGVNRLMFKVLNGGAQWSLSCRITDREGKPLQLTQWDPLAGLAAQNGFVTHYWVLGAFTGRAAWFEKDVFPVGASVDIAKPVASAGKTFTWQPRAVTDAAGGQLNLGEAIGNLQDVCAYAYAEVTSDKAQDILLKMGSDDDIVCWLNGEKVHSKKVDRPCKADEDVVEAKLKAGVNTLLVKVLNGPAGWGTSVRITDRSGKPLVLPQRKP